MNKELLTTNNLSLIANSFLSDPDYHHKYLALNSAAKVEGNTKLCNTNIVSNQESSNRRDTGAQELKFTIAPSTSSQDECSTQTSFPESHQSVPSISSANSLMSAVDTLNPKLASYYDDTTTVLSQCMSVDQLCVFRTKICPKKAADDSCELEECCPFSHCLSWHRRNPRITEYRPSLCPNVIFSIGPNKKMRVRNHCRRGRLCLYAHTKEEQMYHPLVYKTQLCRGWPCCKKHFCPFAHGPQELRFLKGGSSSAVSSSQLGNVVYTDKKHPANEKRCTSPVLRSAISVPDTTKLHSETKLHISPSERTIYNSKTVTPSVVSPLSNLDMTFCDARQLLNNLPLHKQTNDHHENNDYKLFHQWINHQLNVENSPGKAAAVFCSVPPGLHFDRQQQNTTTNFQTAPLSVMDLEDTDDKSNNRNSRNSNTNNYVNNSENSTNINTNGINSVNHNPAITNHTRSGALLAGNEDELQPSLTAELLNAVAASMLLALQSEQQQSNNSLYSKNKESRDSREDSLYLPPSAFETATSGNGIKGHLNTARNCFYENNEPLCSNFLAVDASKESGFVLKHDDQTNIEENSAGRLQTKLDRQRVISNLMLRSSTDLNLYHRLDVEENDNNRKNTVTGTTYLNNSGSEGYDALLLPNLKSTTLNYQASKNNVSLEISERKPDDQQLQRFTSAELSGFLCSSEFHPSTRDCQQRGPPPTQSLSLNSGHLPSGSNTKVTKEAAAIHPKDDQLVLGLEEPKLISFKPSTGNTNTGNNSNVVDCRKDEVVKKTMCSQANENCAQNYNGGIGGGVGVRCDPMLLCPKNNNYGLWHKLQQTKEEHREHHNNGSVPSSHLRNGFGDGQKLSFEDGKTKKNMLLSQEDFFFNRQNTSSDLLQRQLFSQEPWNDVFNSGNHSSCYSTPSRTNKVNKNYSSGSYIFNTSIRKPSDSFLEYDEEARETSRNSAMGMFVEKTNYPATSSNAGRNSYCYERIKSHHLLEKHETMYNNLKSNQEMTPSFYPLKHCNTNRTSIEEDVQTANNKFNSSNSNSSNNNFKDSGKNLLDGDVISWDYSFMDDNRRNGAVTTKFNWLFNSSSPVCVTGSTVESLYSKTATPLEEQPINTLWVAGEDFSPSFWKQHEQEQSSPKHMFATKECLPVRVGNEQGIFPSNAVILDSLYRSSDHLQSCNVSALEKTKIPSALPSIWSALPF